MTFSASPTYEQIEAELIQKGRQEGEMQRSYEIEIALLRQGMEPEAVARLTKLSISMVEGCANEQLPRLEDEV
jgi:DNA-binding TFAR19-related protein (PDSD5 family)